MKGVVSLYEAVQKAKAGLRGGAAWCLALLLSAALLATPAAARQTVSAGQAASAKMLIPVGHTVGIKLFSRGVLVVKLSDGETPAQACGLQTGDVILKCGGISVTSTEQFQALLQKNQDTEMDLQVRRGAEPLKLAVEPVKNQQGQWSIGAWIRDSMAGIGTLTYYDPEDGSFGALGHGITDIDTALLMPFSSGSILPSKVKAVKKGAVGSAGELRGDFDLESNLGTLRANTDQGVFGVADSAALTPTLRQAVPAGKAHAGSATILSNVEGDTVQEYAIEILKTSDAAGDGRDLLLSVVDPALLEITGGIVQGMSGSPILQDGCLVGAVTHVLLNDPSKGYGICIENMLNAAA